MAGAALLLLRRAANARIRRVPACAMQSHAHAFDRHEQLQRHAQEREGRCVTRQAGCEERVNLTPSANAAAEFVEVAAGGLQRLQNGVVQHTGVEVQLAGGGVIIAGT